LWILRQHINTLLA